VKFTGEYDAKLNAKNQVTLPVPLRDMIFFEIEAVRLVLFRRIEGQCIEIYHGDLWEQIQEKVARKALKEKDPDLSRDFNRRAHFFVMNNSGNGRILLPPKFIHFLQPKDELTFIGNTKTIEMWNTHSLDSVSRERDPVSEEKISDILDHINVEDFLSETAEDE
jgi:MraZ protein